MSIGILVNVHDGLVLAADSASTLTVLAAGQGQPRALNVYNNANKIVNLCKGEPVGCVAYGSGSIGSASISTLLKDFRKLFTDGGLAPGIRKVDFSIEGVSRALSSFLSDRVAALQPTEPKPSIGMMIGGYSKGSSLSEAWQLIFNNGVTNGPTMIRPQGDVGINWGGEQEAINRIVLGFSPLLGPTLASLIQPTPTPEQIGTVTQELMKKLQAPLAFAPMPIQDAIDLAEWLVHTAEMFSRFIPGATSVGGPIESAAITKHEGFKWVKRKHYFGTDLNPGGHT
jgi:hypothetical protein